MPKPRHHFKSPGGEGMELDGVLFATCSADIDSTSPSSRTGLSSARQLRAASVIDDLRTVSAKGARICWSTTKRGGEPNEPDWNCGTPGVEPVRRAEVAGRRSVSRRADEGR